MKISLTIEDQADAEAVLATAKENGLKPSEYTRMVVIKAAKAATRARAKGGRDE